MVIIVNNAKDNQDSVQMVEQLPKEQVKYLTDIELLSETADKMYESGWYDSPEDALDALMRDITGELTLEDVLGESDW